MNDLTQTHDGLPHICGPEKHLLSALRPLYRSAKRPQVILDLALYRRLALLFATLHLQAILGWRLAKDLLEHSVEMSQ